jgi:hypothetical protein
MKHRATLFLITLFSILLAAMPAAADDLYSNGHAGTDTDAWTINFGFAVSNTFTLTNASTVTGFSFNAWLFPGDVLETAEVLITANEFGGTTYLDQTAAFVQSDCSVNAYGFNVCEETASLGPVNLAAGTYWVTLENAQVNTGDPVYWDENSGAGCTSPGCPSQASQSSVGSIPSESFTILGNGSTGTTVPEPGTIALVGSGVAGIAGLLRRKLM